MRQTLLEWSADALVPFNAVCVCSDPAVSKSKKKDDLDLVATGVEDLALPATTSVPNIVRQLGHGRKHHPDRLQVIFSTYQSIDKVAQAVEKGKLTVDLVVCDEAHRTTGAALTTEDESYFVKVHDDSFLKADKRLYMSATPRIYGDEAKGRAVQESITLCSMDDETLFGREFYHLGFGEAVEKELLSDYKVLVLTVNRNDIPEDLQEELLEGRKEIDADDITKLVGCLSALSKKMIFDGKELTIADPAPMRKAVAFSQTIRKSMAISAILNKLKDGWCQNFDSEERDKLVDLGSQHIDGSMGASRRDEKMSWLKSEPENPNECRVLSNVRCLSEGVDVPTLDAVLFLAPRNSQIDVVQSIGRVMRRAEGKKFGYVIVPVIIPAHISAEEALDDNKVFAVLWAVLNALKSHDDRFKSVINRLEFNDVKSNDRFLIGGVARPDTHDSGVQRVKNPDLLGAIREQDAALQTAIYARLVKKVGNKQDLLNWAGDVAQIAEGFKKRITEVVSHDGPHKEEFDKFVDGLQQTLNPSVDSAEATEMLAQHLITKPVFEALFENYSFVQHNPVSKALESMIDVLEDQGLEKDRIVLTRFYKTVRDYVSGIDNSGARQRIIVNLYNNFFKVAMPKAVEKLGIVYTPVEIVDFIVNSVAKVLENEFGRKVSDKNVHILDPFTGSGTFITRLIQSGTLGESLEYKYLNEIHANEITLLAYYIASINIENAYHEMMGENSIYQSFDGICLTDTFQLYEKPPNSSILPLNFIPNSDRMESLKKAPIMVVLGNPPYSVGQRSANDNAQNLSYPNLDKRLRETYADKSLATNKNSLYDSYVRAFRWASDRIEKTGSGVIAYISNSGLLDGNAMDGMRKSLVEEFNKIYVFNLRGNQRTSGELSRKEGGKIFGSGSRTPISITILIKNHKFHGPAEIYYQDIGDYLSREQKLSTVAAYHDIYDDNLDWKRIKPNKAGDWLNQRTDVFSSFLPIGTKDNVNPINTFFSDQYANGLKTNADDWMYNYSEISLRMNMKRFAERYNFSVDDYKTKNNNLEFNDYIEKFAYDIKWHSGIIPKAIRGSKCEFNAASIVKSLYRPFNKQNVYYSSFYNQRISLLPKIFPSQSHQNLVICVPGTGGTQEFMPLITDCIPDLHFNSDSQCFPRYYYYEKNDPNTLKLNLFNSGTIIDGYERKEAITDFILKENQSKYGSKVTKDDIFYYVYGFLHNEDYRTTFSADLKKSLSRLPLVDKTEDFWAFSKAGRKLADLHLNYETVDPYDKVKVTGTEKGNFIVDKIRFIRKDDKTAIQYNNNISITGIPLDAYKYVVNGRSAIEWIIDRYQVKTDKNSGIRNDPNDWAKEHDQPSYILDLLLRVITVSLETVKIIEGLPKINF
ncbi:MAG: DEAD/DEAH box helicase family protein [Deltaproteobacteria bacterium]|nr:DEAD/DEAH box helicase family protein [Deltaproteobacteria bacterium]